MPQKPKIWWDQEIASPERSARLFNHVRALEQEQMPVHQDHLVHSKLYSGVDMMGPGWRRSGSSRTRLSFAYENYIPAHTDAAVSLIASHRVKPTPMTDSASFKLRRRASKLDRAIFGTMQWRGWYDVAPTVFRDAVIYNLGVCWVRAEHGQVVYERVHPDALIVDEAEGADPQTFHLRRPVSVTWLLEAYPAMEKEILKAGAQGVLSWIAERPLEEGFVVMVDTYRLPSFPGSGDGRYYRHIEGVELENKAYQHNDPPLVFMRWSEPDSGFYATTQGAVARAKGLQILISKLNRYIDRSQDLVSFPRTYLKVGSMDPGTRMDNIEGRQYWYRDQPPLTETPAAVHPEIYNYKAAQIAAMSKIFGLDRAALQGERPTGEISGAAIREMTDAQLSRHGVPLASYEDATRRGGLLTLRALRKIHTKNPKKQTIQFLTAGGITSSEWKDIDIEEDHLSMRIDASSVLNESPAAKRATIAQFVQNGWMTVDEAISLLGEPDIAQWRLRSTAEVDSINSVIERMLDGEQVSPDPHQNIEMGIKMCQAEYNRIQAEFHIIKLSAEESSEIRQVLQTLRNWVTGALDMIEPELGTPDTGMLAKAAQSGTENVLPTAQAQEQVLGVAQGAADLVEDAQVNGPGGQV